MEQYPTDKQGGVLLGKPTKPGSRRQELEATVKERTSQYASLNIPVYDQKLMEAHLELASIYHAERNVEQARSHLRAAEHEFFIMSRVETQEPNYSMGGKEGFQKRQEQRDAIERRLEEYKRRLLETANKIDYDTSRLMFIPTNDKPNDKNLVELIEKFP